MIPSPPGRGRDPGGGSQESLRYFSSWSGGKDSALALHRVWQRFGPATSLLTMMVEGGRRSRSHGLSSELLAHQAASLGVPLALSPTSWSDYEARFGAALARFGRRGIRAGVYGDIDLEEHRRWVQDISATWGSTAFQPLWGLDRRELMEEFLGLGFKARVVAVKKGRLPRELLGEELTWKMLEEVVRLGCDMCGEAGEYHTVVWDGPLFAYPVTLSLRGTLERDGYFFQDFEASSDPAPAEAD